MPTSEYTPTLADVGAIMRARTRDDTGTELGTFTTATRPTDAEVTTLIAHAVDLVAAKVGADVPTAWRASAKRTAALLAATLIEGAYWPENTGESGQSARTHYYELYTDSLAALVDALEGQTPGQQVYSVTTTSVTPDDLV